MKKIYCFPDTNLFIQCKPIEEWDWSVFEKCEAIDVLITRPVQKEIDEHKGKGNARVAARARATSAIFRDAIVSSIGYKQIRAMNPCVRLHVRAELKPDQALQETLSLDEADDQLVAIAAGFLKDNADACITLATHDTGPMASAKLVGLHFTVIPDSWLLPPEVDKTSKDLKRVTQELERYKKAEPAFSVYWTNGDSSVESVSAVLNYYSPLEPYEILTLVQQIKQQYPMSTDFGESETKERNTQPVSDAMGNGNSLQRIPLSFNNLLGKNIYIPASATDISQYKQAYEQWLQDCEDLLKNLHARLAEKTTWPRLSVELKNTGTRSAENALVTLSARGKFGILPFKQKEPDGDMPVALARPPKAPQGSWQNRYAQSLRLGSRAFLQSIQGDSPYTDHLLPSAHNALNLLKKREEDAFYYKSGRPYQPVPQYGIECALWRHQSDAEVFDLTLHVELMPAKISGVVEVTVQSSNVSDVFTQRLPIHIEVQQAVTLEYANELVDNLLRTRNY